MIDLCRRNERGDFDLDLRAGIDETLDVEQRRGREASPKRLAPGRADAGTRGFVPTFDQTRAEFEETWAVFLSNRTDADFKEWRAAQAFTAWQYRMWDTGNGFPSQAT